MADIVRIVDKVGLETFTAPTCPKCSVGIALPFRVESNKLAAIRVDVRCDKCRHEWQIAFVATLDETGTGPNETK